MCRCRTLLMYGELPSQPELSRWDETLMRHSAIPAAVEKGELCGAETLWAS